MHQTTLRFGPGLWSELEGAAREAGVSIAQFVREATVARMAYTAGREGDDRFDRALESAHGEATHDALESAVDALRSTSQASSDRALALDHLNVLLESILGRAGVAVVVLDADHRVQTWNGASKAMWGESPEDVIGQSFLSLDVGLPVDRLQKGIDAVLAEGEKEAEAVVEATRAGGRKFTCAVRILPLPAPDGSHHGVVLLLEDRDAGVLLARAPGHPPES